MNTSKRIAAVLLSAPLMLGFSTAVAYADQPPNKGQGGATEDKSTGAPTNPNGFGTVSSQLATTDTGIGDHTSRFAPGQDDDAEPAQRLGVGNVSRTDGGLTTDPEDNTGGRPGDHAGLIDDGLDNNPDTDANGHPGKPK